MERINVWEFSQKDPSLTVIVLPETTQIIVVGNPDGRVDLVYCASCGTCFSLWIRSWFAVMMETEEITCPSCAVKVGVVRLERRENLKTA